MNEFRSYFRTRPMSFRKLFFTIYKNILGFCITTHYSFLHKIDMQYSFNSTYKIQSSNFLGFCFIQIDPNIYSQINQNKQAFLHL